MKAKILRHLPGQKLKITKEQLLCLAGAAALAFLSWFNTPEPALQDGHSIARGVPGSPVREIGLQAEGIGEQPVPVQVRVSPREYTEEEAGERIQALIEELALHITGENSSLREIRTDLSFPRTVPGFDGIRLSWYPEEPSLIGYDGKVSNLGLSEARESAVRVILRAGSFREEYVLPVTVLPAELSTEDKVLELLEERIRDADRGQISNAALTLPQELEGRRIRWEEPRSKGWIRILALGLGACALLGFKPEQDRRQRQKKRETELLLDYSDVVPKLVIYMGAGLTAANAWLKITDHYRETREKGGASPRIVYEEMEKTAGELRQGVPEGKAFADFAGRCEPGCYRKLISLLEQNRRTGDPRSEAALLLEAEESFEQRKNTARRLGEEAGTKLMLPLIISLMTVMIIVGVPAMMTLA